MDNDPHDEPPPRLILLPCQREKGQKGLAAVHGVIDKAHGDLFVSAGRPPQIPII